MVVASVVVASMVEADECWCWFSSVGGLRWWVLICFVEDEGVVDCGDGALFVGV